MKKCLLLVTVMTSFLILFCSCDGTTNTSTPTIKPTTQTPTEPAETTPSTGTESTEGPTAPADGTPAPATPGTTPTQKPSDPTPTAPVTGDAYLSKSGSIRSNTGTSFNMRADWTAVQKTENDPIQVTVKLYLECYTLTVRASSGTVSINDKQSGFSSEAIDKTEMVKNEILLTTYTQDIASAGASTQLTISADWLFRGVYSGVEIESLTINETVTLAV